MKNVRRIHRCIAQALILIIKLRGLHQNAWLFFQMRGDGFAEELLAITLLLLRLLLVPDEDAERVRLRGEPRL